jgi:hypothetical protein
MLPDIMVFVEDSEKAKFEALAWHIKEEKGGTPSSLAIS